jgi:hypothetical protein
MSATSSEVASAEVASENGVDPLNQVIQDAGLDPLLRHMRLITDPSTTALERPIISVAEGRTERGKQKLVPNDLNLVSPPQPRNCFFCVGSA